MQFGRAVQPLCDSGVDFVIIGGVSTSLSGSSYITNDLDICYARPSENLKRLAIDLMAEVIGLGDFEAVKRNSLFTHAFDRDVYALDLPGLIRSKRAAGRPKDLLVLPELEGLLEAREPEPTD